MLRLSIILSALLLCVVRYASAESRYVVSLVRLLVKPEEYVGQNIKVDGFLTSDMHLYLTSEHARAFDVKSSILVSDVDDGSITSSPCVDEFVSIYGVFHHLEFDQFILSDVKKVEKSFLDAVARNCWSKSSD